jgi:hypothetical protein
MKFKTNFDIELEKCQNMEQVLDCVSKHYNLSQPFGIATKIMVIGGVKKIISLIKALPKM